MPDPRWFVAALLAATTACAARVQSDVASPSADGPAIEQVETRLGELEDRVQRLEHELAAKPESAGESVSLGWSCMAKCGTRSTQTTEFKVEYERVTGHGSTAAEAYEAMLADCGNGTIYERIEDERFLGGEMKNVCLNETAAQSGR